MEGFTVPASVKVYTRRAAIDAVASIRPHEALEILDDLADSDDEDIVDAVHEAMAMAEGPSDDDDELDDDDDSRSR